jgi:uncharacterized sporulation protein YeaH/YhbH (DUF444 family)
MHIVDRRLNPGGKSLANRQRFLRRAKALVQRAVRDSTKERDIKGLDQGGEISIPIDGVREPSLRRDSETGSKDYVLPGNKRFIEGDTIERPSGGRGGRGSEGSPDGGGEDDFRFVLSREEFIDLFLDDLELPDLAKKRVTTLDSEQWRRAGFTVAGSPANLALKRTMQNSLSRRIALRRPRLDDIEELRARIQELEESGADDVELAWLRDKLAALDSKSRRVPYIDPIDLRFRRFERYPKPIAQAVMFCLMDVSGSMTEHMKDLAKRFFMLLHLFLARRYRHVEVVFIRHTHEAKEVDEETFFHGTETGGTLVSSAFEEMRRVVTERFSPQDWNIYAAQVSDGDNSSTDAARTERLVVEEILPAVQYFAYLEVGSDEGPRRAGFVAQKSELWRTYEGLRGGGAQIAMRRASHRREIYPVFRDLFQRREKAEEPNP